MSVVALKVFKTLTGRYQLTGQCVYCQKNICVTVDPQEFFNWNTRGQYIQFAFPTMSADEREFLISGICGECFDGIFEQHEENRADSIAEARVVERNKEKN